MHKGFVFIHRKGRFIGYKIHKDPWVCSVDWTAVNSFKNIGSQFLIFHYMLLKALVFINSSCCSFFFFSEASFVLLQLTLIWKTMPRAPFFFF